jgi:hypothetical protein
MASANMKNSRTRQGMGNGFKIVSPQKCIEKPNVPAST